jgi:hypothetical protein
MGQRIRQLEDALTIFQSGVSNDVHPLLTTEQLAIKFGPENVQDQEPRVEPSLTATMDALGTLTVGENGGARFFGRSAGAEVRIIFLLLSSKFDEISRLCSLLVPNMKTLNHQHRLCLSLSKSPGSLMHFHSESHFLMGTHFSTYYGLISQSK